MNDKLEEAYRAGLALGRRIAREAGPWKGERSPSDMRDERARRRSMSDLRIADAGGRTIVKAYLNGVSDGAWKTTGEQP